MIAFIQIDARTGIVLVHKTGVSSVWRAVDETPGKIFRNVSVEQFATLPIRVAHLREPKERMQSAFRFLQTGEDFSTFVLRTCENPYWNMHTQPQADYARHANTLVRWDFAELATVLGVVSIPHLNASTDAPCVWTDEARSAFERAYAADLALWRAEPRR